MFNDFGLLLLTDSHATSQLCNVLFTREFQRRLEQNGYNIKVNCFNPGLIVGTGKKKYTPRVLAEYT
jgi:hypothetical protein